MHTSIFVRNKKVGVFEESTGTLIFNKKITHIYKTLNSFCVNSEVLSRYDWKNILFKCDFNTEYKICKIEFDKLFDALNMYISFGDERQVAIPIAMMDTIDSLTKIVKVYGTTVRDFIDKKISLHPYQSWKSRINLKYYLGE